MDSDWLLIALKVIILILKDNGFDINDIVLCSYSRGVDFIILLNLERFSKRYGYGSSSRCEGV